MSKISLTASMRSNLLSLQSISKLQDQTQLRLATGLKVNSAIDNPSSYYTAQSLANRAADLSSLLDAMGQGIQTIKAANEGIETAQTLVEQMKSIAEQVTNSSQVPDKEYFIDKVGANGAVVSTADELRAAIQSGKETICVYGQIDLGDISTSGGITLAENQKLVGVNYFGNFSNGEGFSKISATSNYANKDLITINKTGGLISDLNINYENYVLTTSDANAIHVVGNNATADLRNLNVSMRNNGSNMHVAISTHNYASINIGGKINIGGLGGKNVGLWIGDCTTVNIQADAELNISTTGKSGSGIGCVDGAVLDVASGARVNIVTSGDSSLGFQLARRVNANIAAGAIVKITTLGRDGRGIYTATDNVNLTIGGELQISTTNDRALVSYGTINILSTAQLDLTANQLMSTNATGQINLAAKAKVAVEIDGQKKWYELQAGGNVTGNVNIRPSDFATKLNVAETEPWQTVTKIFEEKSREDKENETFTLVMTDELSSYQQQYNKALSQYDKLISDSSYKGVNLLKGESLKINFNEDRSAGLVVQGEDLSSDKIGLGKAEWTTTKSLQESLEQVLDVTSILRDTANALGNYYSIITTREDFTSNLINVLEEGADKLTLADMNEESANMLALQTRQSLAINSLSLASQANQAILKLF